jgi:hypothetical protein
MKKFIFFAIVIGCIAGVLEGLGSGAIIDRNTKLTQQLDSI